MIWTLIQSNACSNGKCFAEKFWQPWWNWTAWVTLENVVTITLTNDTIKQMLLAVKVNTFFKDFQSQSLWRIGMVFTTILLPKNRAYTNPNCLNKMLLLRASFQHIKQLEKFHICIIKWLLLLFLNRITRHIMAQLWG